MEDFEWLNQKDLEGIEQVGELDVPLALEEIKSLSASRRQHIKFEADIACLALMLRTIVKATSNEARINQLTIDFPPDFNTPGKKGIFWHRWKMWTDEISR